MGAVSEQISGDIVVDKQDRRKRLASLSFTEKVKILEKLRDRSLAIAASGLRKAQSTK